MLHDSVDPEGSLLLVFPVISNRAVAHGPGLSDSIVNVESRLNGSIVHPRRQVLGVHGLSHASLRHDVGRVMLQPRSVLAERVAELVLLLNTVDDGGAPALRVSALEAVSRSLSVQVVPVETLRGRRHLLPETVALGRTVVRAQVIEVILAALASVFSEQLVRDDVEVVEDLREARRDVIVPVSGTIANDNSLNVEKVLVEVSLLLHVSLVYLPGQVRSVDAAVTLTSDEERVVLLRGTKLRECIIPLEQCLIGIVSLNVVIEMQIDFATDRVAYTGR